MTILLHILLILGMEMIALKIEGMTCGHCVSSVERLLSNVDGVESYVISLPDKAKISFDQTKVSVADLKKIINDSEIYKVA